MEMSKLRKMDVKSLKERVTLLKRELFDLKLSAASTPIKDNSQFRKLRADIARALMCLGEKVKEGSPSREVK